MINPIDETTDIDAVDIESVEKNTMDETPGDEETPNEEKKGKTPKKMNSMLDVRRRIEDMIEIKKMREFLDYLHEF